MRNCLHCSEYNRQTKMCGVVFLWEGEDYQLEIFNPEKPCLLETNGLLPEVKSVRKWSDGKNGYIEYVNSGQEKTPNN